MCYSTELLPIVLFICKDIIGSILGELGSWLSVMGPQIKKNKYLIFFRNYYVIVFKKNNNSYMTPKILRSTTLLEKIM